MLRLPPRPPSLALSRPTFIHARFRMTTSFRRAPRRPGARPFIGAGFVMPTSFRGARGRAGAGPFIGALLAGAAALVALGSSSEARADAAGDKILAAVDVAMNRAKTQIFDYDVTNQEPGKDE